MHEVSPFPIGFTFANLTMGCAVVSAAISKSETAKCRPVEDLSALNQTSGQERKQGTKSLCSAKPAPDHSSKAYHSIIESPGTVKTRVFHF